MLSVVCDSSQENPDESESNVMSKLICDDLNMFLAQLSWYQNKLCKHCYTKVSEMAGASMGWAGRWSSH